jgi:hypothetical protein
MIYSSFEPDAVWGHGGGSSLLAPVVLKHDHIPRTTENQLAICPFCDRRHFEICAAELRQLLGRV